jgi:hypothetical protein
VASVLGQSDLDFIGPEGCTGPEGAPRIQMALFARTEQSQVDRALEGGTWAQHTMKPL